MTDKVKVSFNIRVRGTVGGSFEIDREEFDRIRAAWQKRPNSLQETDLAEQLMDSAMFDYMRHINIDEMEIEQLEEKP